MVNKPHVSIKNEHGACISNQPDERLENPSQRRYCIAEFEST